MHFYSFCGRKTYIWRIICRFPLDVQRFVNSYKFALSFLTPFICFPAIFVVSFFLCEEKRLNKNMTTNAIRKMSLNYLMNCNWLLIEKIKEKKNCNRKQFQTLSLYYLQLSFRLFFLWIYDIILAFVVNAVTIWRCWMEQRMNRCLDVG